MSKIDFDRAYGAMALLELDPDKPRGELRTGILYRHRNGEDTVLGTKTVIDRSHHITDNRMRPDNGLPATYDDMYDIAREFGRAMLQHPFVKLSRCKSPIETEFYFNSLDKIRDLEPQVRIRRYTVDFAVIDRRTVIELYGHEYHHKAEDVAYDTAREKQLIEWGWEVIIFDGKDVYADVYACIDKAKAIIDAQPNYEWA